MEFKISKDEFEQREKRILYGFVLSVLLAGIVSYQHFNYPEDYNELLLWSVLGFVGLANLVNYYRHRKYLTKAKQHSIQVLDSVIRFKTNNEISELNLDDVAAMRVFRQKNGIGHIQLSLSNGRGIRLEGYSKMDLLVEELKRLLPHKQMDK